MHLRKQKSSFKLELERIIGDSLKTCHHCGRCLSVCPIYNVTKIEPFSPRGKIILLKELLSNNISWKKKLKEIINSCLLCGACNEVCIGEIDTAEIVRRLRSKAIRRGIIEPSIIILKSSALTPKRKDALAKTALSIMDLLSTHYHHSGLKYRFPLSILEKNFYLPKPARIPFLKRISHPESQLAKKNAENTIAFFIGCMGNYFYTDISLTSLYLLKETGYHIVIPTNQGCCGMPAYSAGEYRIAKANALNIINNPLFLRARHIVTFCGSCAYHLKKNLPELFDKETEERNRAEKIALNVVELSAFLTGAPETFYRIKRLVTEKENEKVKAIYHDPCHLARGLGIRKPPREMIRLLPDVELIDDMECSNVCCGYGGIFQLKFPDLSKKIIEYKFKKCSMKEVDIVLTSCMGCLLQFKEWSKRDNLNITVAHWVELFLPKMKNKV